MKRKHSRRTRSLRIKSVRPKDRPTYLNPGINELDWIPEPSPVDENRETDANDPPSLSSDQADPAVEST